METLSQYRDEERQQGPFSDNNRDVDDIYEYITRLEPALEDLNEQDHLFPFPEPENSNEQDLDEETEDESMNIHLRDTIEAILMEDDAMEPDCNSDTGDLYVASQSLDDDPKPDDLTFIKLARLQARGGISRDTYGELRHIFRELGLELPCLRRAEARLRRFTGISVQRIDCCINVCIAYTGEFTSASACPRCKEPRLSTTGQPRNQFTYIPITHRLAVQYRNADRARLLKSYRQSFDQPQVVEPQLRDVFDGALYHRFHKEELGLFRNPHDIALHLSLDGVQMTNLKNHEAECPISPLIQYTNGITVDHTRHTYKS